MMLTEREREVLREWDEFSKAVPPSIDGLREAYANYSEGQNRDLPQIAEYKEGVALRPGLNADIAVPKGAGSHPVMLYIHGGACVAGSARTHKKVAWSSRSRATSRSISTIGSRRNTRSRQGSTTACLPPIGSRRTRNDGAVIPVRCSSVATRRESISRQRLS